jgi:hypothetical protein
MQFTDYQLDDAYRWLSQQRKHFPPDADIWYFRFCLSDDPKPEGCVKLLLYLWNSGNRVFMFPKFVFNCRLSYCSQHSPSQRVAAEFDDFANRDAVAVSAGLSTILRATVVSNNC